MRNAPNLKAEKFRNHELSRGAVNMNSGAFEVGNLCVIISDIGGWDHVSVHGPNRCPTWEEMCKIKELFFKDDETVMQLHPAKSNYINCHPYTLHLWRPQSGAEWMAHWIVWQNDRDEIKDESLRAFLDRVYAKPPGEIPLPPREMV
ncbi:MAG: hypothetical protein WBM14_19305 [Terracidiphilus sp.]